ncbi:hypothetical protein [Desulfosarcina variabilis]|uniref:hypothetical protein n=1 Tax=Desulfosarcina variabilis TaxID=2300 RepID=UPI003AFAF88A
MKASLQSEIKTGIHAGAGRFMIFMVGVLLMFPSVVDGAPKTLQACGMAQVEDGNIGRAKTKALQDAQRNAVEMGLGTLIDSDTIVNNAVLIQDRIYSRASGYVTDYKVTSEGLTPSGKAVETCIEATVDTADIKADLRAIGILKQRVGNPRFMVVYLPEEDGESEAGTIVIKEAGRAINDAFLKKGFMVIKRSFAKDFVRQAEQHRVANTDLQGMSRLALTYQADLLLLFDVDASDRGDLSNPYFKEVTLTLSIQSISPGTAELIASNAKSKRVRTSKSMQTNYYESPMVAKAVSRLAQQVAENTMADTLAYFERQTNEGTLYTCRFKGFGPNDLDTIVGVIENLGGYRDKNVRNQFSDQVQVDINYLGKKFDFQRELLSGLERKGIATRIESVEGNDFLIIKFSKP